jgi:hypothetical protein
VKSLLAADRTPEFSAVRRRSTSAALPCKWEQAGDLVLREAGGVVVCLTPHQQRGGDFVFLCQPDYLGAELSSRTDKGHALIQPSTAIFRDQQAYERFACSSRQLDCNILGLKVIGEIGVQRLFLMAPQEFNGRVSLQVSE